MDRASYYTEAELNQIFAEHSAMKKAVEDLLSIVTKCDVSEYDSQLVTEARLTAVEVESSNTEHAERLTREQAGIHRRNGWVVGEDDAPGAIGDHLTD